MNNQINTIFTNNIDLLSYIAKAIFYLRIQNFYKGLFYSTKIIDKLLLNLELIISNQLYFNDSSIYVDNNSVNQILSGLLEAQNNKDYILLADLFEIQLAPFILNIQEIIISKTEVKFDEEHYLENINYLVKKSPALGEQLKKMVFPFNLLYKAYSVEYTSCGLLTLALIDKDKKYYMHSNGQAIKDAGILAREWFSNDFANYIIYGLGFGYHVSELMELDDSITISVYESDINIIQLACAFSNMKKILSSDRVNIIYDPHFTELSIRTKNMSNDTKYVIHYPSLRNIKNLKVREQLEDYFIIYSSINNQLHSLNNNFRKNIKNCDAYIDDLREKFHDKDLYIVAAGPSLDNNYLQLKEIKNNSIILATGTVLKKLLNAEIKPDYAIIIDANDLVYQQIEGIEEEQIPILILSTVYHKIPENYKGYKYLICQEGYQRAEEYANKMGYNLYQTGGSVSTTALDIGIQFGCKRIIFIGLDLAYTKEKDHAFNIPTINMQNSAELRQVEDISGNLVATGKNLDMYRKWIENRIKNITKIEFIDATEGGAKIKGMRIKYLKDTINL